MTDNSRDVTATLVGAVLGATAGYLFFTDRGRRVRQQFDRALDEVAREPRSHPPDAPCGLRDGARGRNAARRTGGRAGTAAANPDHVNCWSVTSMTWA